MVKIGILGRGGGPFFDKFAKKVAEGGLELLNWGGGVDRFSEYTKKRGGGPPRVPLVKIARPA